jgi:hypothetical protein
VQATKGICELTQNAREVAQNKRKYGPSAAHGNAWIKSMMQFANVFPYKKLRFWI